MFRILAIVAVVSGIAASAAAQSAVDANPDYTESVTLMGFDFNTKTYTAYVSVNGPTCHNDSVNESFQIPGVRDDHDAREKAREKVEVIAATIRASKAQCDRH